MTIVRHFNSGNELSDSVVLGVAGEMTLEDMCWSIRILTSTHLFPAIFRQIAWEPGF